MADDKYSHAEDVSQPKPELRLSVPCLPEGDMCTDIGSVEDELIALRILDSISEASSKDPGHAIAKTSSFGNLSEDSSVDPRMEILMPADTYEGADGMPSLSFRSYSKTEPRQPSAEAAGSAGMTHGLIESRTKRIGTDPGDHVPSPSSPPRNHHYLSPFDSSTDTQKQGDPSLNRTNRYSMGNSNKLLEDRPPVLLLARAQVEVFPSDESVIDPPPTVHIYPRTLERATSNEEEEEDTYETFQNKEHTLDEFEDTIASSDIGDIPLKHILTHKAVKGILQPDLLVDGPTGLLLVVDKVLECFDQPVAHSKPFNLHDDVTIDSPYDELEWDAALEQDSTEWLFPCCHDLGPEDNSVGSLSDEDSALDDGSKRRLYSKGSLLGSDASFSLPEKTFEGLQLEDYPMKALALNQTATTDGDSTVEPDPDMEGTDI